MLPPGSSLLATSLLLLVGTGPHLICMKVDMHELRWRVLPNAGVRGWENCTHVSHGHTTIRCGLLRVLNSDHRKWVPPFSWLSATVR